MNRLDLEKCKQMLARFRFGAVLLMQLELAVLLLLAGLARGARDV